MLNRPAASAALALRESQTVQGIHYGSSMEGFTMIKKGSLYYLKLDMEAGKHPIFQGPHRKHMWPVGDQVEDIARWPALYFGHGGSGCGLSMRASQALRLGSPRKYRNSEGTRGLTSKHPKPQGAEYLQHLERLRREPRRAGGSGCRLAGLPCLDLGRRGGNNSVCPSLSVRLCLFFCLSAPLACYVHMAYSIFGFGICMYTCFLVYIHMHIPLYIYI